MRFFVRRISFYLATAWLALTLNFIIPRLMPGDPVQEMFARTKQTATPQALAAMRAALGVDTHASLLSQYLSYLGDVLHGQLGTSISYYPAAVSTVIGAALPWTLFLVGTATVISFVVGTLLGIASAWRRGSWVDHLLPVTAFLSAIPYFWLGAVAIFLFGNKLGWFPLTGAYNPGLSPGFNLPFALSALDYGVLPAGTIVISSLAGWLLGMRNVMILTIPEDYVLLAQAKGLRNRRVIFTYAARNAILPTLASFALSLGFVVGGAILTEIVFSYPGVGYVLFQAVTNQDYPLMQGLFLTITMMVLLANLLADVAYAVLDPRTRESRR
ncbi:MAG: ABC transporter permease [Streptosporangiaceae bacterium]